MLLLLFFFFLLLVVKDTKLELNFGRRYGLIGQNGPACEELHTPGKTPVF